jgi:hypothetical protein
MDVFPSKNLNILTTSAATVTVRSGVDVVNAVTAIGTPQTITLPTAVGCRGKALYLCKNAGGGGLTEDVKFLGAGSENIGFQNQLWLSRIGDAVMLVSDGAGWIIVSQYFSELQNYSENDGGVTAGASGAYKDVASLVLPASGVYEVSVSGYTSFGGTATGNGGLALSANSGASTADHVQGKNELLFPAGAISAGNHGITLPPLRLSISGSTTYYMKGMFTYSSGTPSIAAYGYARRIGFYQV